jgi:outer membrane murein-binding lipoprotein Lpp
MTVFVFALIGGLVGLSLLSGGGFVFGALVGALAGWVSDLAGRVRTLERRLEAVRAAESRALAEAERERRAAPVAEVAVPTLATAAVEPNIAASVATAKPLPAEPWPAAAVAEAQPSAAEAAGVSPAEAARARSPPSLRRWRSCSAASCSGSPPATCR